MTLKISWLKIQKTPNMSSKKFLEQLAGEEVPY